MYLFIAVTYWSSLSPFLCAFLCPVLCLSSYTYCPVLCLSSYTYWPTWIILSYFLRLFLHRIILLPDLIMFLLLSASFVCIVLSSSHRLFIVLLSYPLAVPTASSSLYFFFTGSVSSLISMCLSSELTMPIIEETSLDTRPLQFTDRTAA